MWNPALSFPVTWGNTLTLGVAPHALAPGFSDPQDPNFEKRNKGDYDYHYLHLHFRQKSSDTIANTKILISAKRYWDYEPLLPSSMITLLEEEGKGQS